VAEREWTKQEILDILRANARLRQENERLKGVLRAIRKLIEEGAFHLTRSKVS
jgi:regulator of replication initiation timing